MSKVIEKLDKKNLELGTLIVVLLKARNLNDKHSFRKQDVFAQATLNGVQKRSHVDIRGGQHPEWDSETRFTVLKDNGPDGKNRKLEVACYAQEPRKEELLGKATLDISDTLKSGEFDDWVSLDVDGVVRGDIYLEMTYYANAPTPVASPNNKLLATVQGNTLGRRPSKLSPSDRLSRPIQKNISGPLSPKQSSRLLDQSNPTSSHLNNVVPSISENGSLPNLTAHDPVHASATLSNTLEPISLSPSQLAVLPPILRPGSGSFPLPNSDSGQQHEIRHNRTLSESSIYSNSRSRSTTSDVHLSQLDYTGGSGAYTVAHSGLSNIDDTLSSNPYIMGSGAYVAGQQHQQVPFGRAYSPIPPGAFTPENQPGPDGRSYSPASRVQTSGSPHLDDGSLNPYAGGKVQQQASSGRAYSPVPLSVSKKVSGPSHRTVPVFVSSPNPYTGNGAVYLLENQTGPNLPSHCPAPPISVQISGSLNIDHSAPTGSRTGESGVLVPVHQQVPDGRVYSSTQPVNAAQTSGYVNYVTSLQAPSGPLSYDAGTESSSLPSGSLTFPIPVIPVLVTEHHRYHEPSSYTRPGLGGRSAPSSYYQPPLPPPRTSPVSNNRSEHKEVLDPPHIMRYQTPLPLPPESIKENSLLPPSPSPSPPPTPAMAAPVQVSSLPSLEIAPTVAPDATRVQALRKMEQDSARRKEQELQDLEFAMQLDRELNLQ